MPNLLQGDIFAATIDRRCELTIVLGRIGFNEMSGFWQDFARTQPTLAHVRDPFSEISGRLVRFQNRQWLWFVPEGENHGLTNSQFTAALTEALTWASGNLVKSVMTNGIANIDYGTDTTSNRASDDARAQFLIDLAATYEEEFEVTINLISLNDVFLRNAAKSAWTQLVPTDSDPEIPTDEAHNDSNWGPPFPGTENIFPITTEDDFVTACHILNQSNDKFSDYCQKLEPFWFIYGIGHPMHTAISVGRATYVEDYWDVRKIQTIAGAPLSYADKKKIVSELASTAGHKLAYSSIPHPGFDLFPLSLVEFPDEGILDGEID